MLIASVAKVDAIASGTWMNLRSFPPAKFRASYDDEIKQRAIWYYCPQALSEYKLFYLDIAKKLGKLTLLALFFVALAAPSIADLSPDTG